MADTVTQLVARLAPFTGLSADVVENVIHIGSTGSLSGPDLTDAMTAFRDFYLVDTGAAMTHPLAYYISGSVVRTANACSILAYETDDLTGETPFGSPIDMLNFTMGASSGGNALPQEVAVVASYQADLSGVPVSESNPSPPPATIRPAQRRRGRLYLGPLNVSALSADAASPRPVNSLLVDLGVAFATMASAIGTLTTGYLGVWSRADAEVWQYASGYVDNAWDTQRRRGVDPTARAAFPVI